MNGHEWLAEIAARIAGFRDIAREDRKRLIALARKGLQFEACAAAESDVEAAVDAFHFEMNFEDVEYEDGKVFLESVKAGLADALLAANANRMAREPKAPTSEVQAAMMLAAWLGYAWDGLGNESVASRGAKPWCFDGLGHRKFQGGKDDLIAIVRSIRGCSTTSTAAQAADNEVILQAAEAIKARMTEAVATVAELEDVEQTLKCRVVELEKEKREAFDLGFKAAGGTKPRRYRHKKRGTECVVIGGALLQTSEPLYDNARLVLYRDGDGSLWARPFHEFEDGRFEEIDPCEPAQATASAAQAATGDQLFVQAGTAADGRPIYRTLHPLDIIESQSDEDAAKAPASAAQAATDALKRASSEDHSAEVLGQIAANAVGAHWRSKGMHPDQYALAIDQEKFVSWQYRERAEKAEAQVETLREALAKIVQWGNAYPLDVFPEPDFPKARRILKAGGMSMDTISASNMRHVVAGVLKIVSDALAATEKDTSNV